MAPQESNGVKKSKGKGKGKEKERNTGADDTLQIPEQEPERFTESPTPLSEHGDDEVNGHDSGEEEDGAPGSGSGSGSDEGEDEEGKEEEEAENAEEEDKDDEENDEEEESEEEDDDEDDDEDEEEEEPALKYSLIRNAIPDLLKKDSASALAISNKIMVLGTHAGIIHILSLDGTRIKSYKPHMASILDITIDESSDFVGTASIDGQIHIRSLLPTPESYTFDQKRPMRTLALEPHFSKRSTRAVIFGGLSGTLILKEKGWLGHKDTILHNSPGEPIWSVKWKERLAAWVTDAGVKIYDMHAKARISSVEPPESNPRGDLFRCSLLWQDESTLLIAWADSIKVARVRARPRVGGAGEQLVVEITSHLKVDCVVSGLVPCPTPSFAPSPLAVSIPGKGKEKGTKTQPTSFLILAYTPNDTYTDLSDPGAQKRKAAERPELRIISRSGEELSADLLSITEYTKWQCNDYILASFPNESGDEEGGGYVVMSPKDLVLVRRRDRWDHVRWLVERERYEEALGEIEVLEDELAASVPHTTSATATLTSAPPSIAASGSTSAAAPVQVPAKAAEGEAEKEGELSVQTIGQKYINHLITQSEFVKAARLCPKVCKGDIRKWEDWIFVFADRRQLQAIIPYVPTESPQLDHVVYEMILAHFLSHDRQTLLKTIKEWPRNIYDITAVIVAVRADLDKVSGSKTMAGGGKKEEEVVLMECLAELYTANRQPGKALPYFLRLRRPNVFELIKDNNLFTDVSDQVLLLVEFDHELMNKHKLSKSLGEDRRKSEAITLLVNHMHSIPIMKVVPQLEQRPYYLFLYLDELVQKDPNLVAPYANVLVKLYAEFATPRLIDFLRVSSDYHLDYAYQVCKERDLILEMVFILGRMGNNKEALTVIIERLGDVHRAIEFAKEQNDDELWEDLLKYSETRPAFIRGLLENVGVEISPIRLIRRIKNGLEIPGLKEALIKILQDFHLQISLLEGCQAILNGDSSDLSRRLQKNQNSGFFLTAKTTCPICTKPLQDNPQSLVFLYLCRHVVHASCVSGGDALPPPPDPILRPMNGSGRGISGSIAYESMIRGRLRRGCPVCHKNSEGLSTTATATR